MQNGFIHFFYHELTQSCEYEQVLLFKHAINRNNKQKKMLLLLMELLTVFILLMILPTSQELIHWFVLLGVCV